MQISFADKIKNLIKSGFQTIYVYTPERSRCEAQLQEICNDIQLEMVTWDGVDGFSLQDKAGIKDPIEAILALASDQTLSTRKAAFVFRNLNIYLEDPTVRQAFQNMYYTNRFSNSDCVHPAIILSNSLQVHPDIAPCVTIVEFALPTEEDLTTVFTQVASTIEVEDKQDNQVVSSCDDEMKNRIIQAMRGLTSVEAENILAYGLRVNRGFSPSLVESIEDQKAGVLEKSEVLRYVPKAKITTIDQIGGYSVLKDFINTRKLAYTRKAKEIGLDLPKGIVLLGIMGTGKSVVGKVVARCLDLPLVIMNFSAVFGSLVGESERRIRTSLDTIDAMDGAVLLIDEADKMLAGARDATGDSGVTRRVFGEVLKWLTEKTSRTFVVMTMNRTAGIDDEFFRKGRLTFCRADNKPLKLLETPKAEHATAQLEMANANA